MGGLIVLQYALQKQSNLEFTGIICCSPAIKNASPIHPVKYWGGRLLAPLLPKICVKSGLDFTNISSIPKIVQEYKNDPLVHPYISLGTGTHRYKNDDGLIF